MCHNDASAELVASLEEHVSLQSIPVRHLACFLGGGLSIL